MCKKLETLFQIYSHMEQSRKFFHPASKRRREFQLARMMMVLVVVFLVLNSPRLVLGLIEVTQLSSVELCYRHGLDYHIHKQTYLLDFAARFLVIVNSSINFIIYCLVGSEFRHHLMAMFNITHKAEVSSGSVSKDALKCLERREQDMGNDEQSITTAETSISKQRG